MKLAGNTVSNYARDIALPFFSRSASAARERSGIRLPDRPSLTILGTRGLPARHGGFETFAERLAIYLVKRGWDVEVYCQDGPNETGPTEYNGVKLNRIRVNQAEALGSIIFDWKALRQALSGPPRLLLTLGYNTGAFSALSRVKGRINLVNMDGFEWRRAKWSRPIRTWFWANERLACYMHNHLIADHPVIADHLATRVSRESITQICYGSDRVDHADPAVLQALGLVPGQYALLIARPEPENSILEAVRAFSRRPRGSKLVVLGKINADCNDYQRAIVAAASPEVVFPGPIYQPEVLAALRLYCRFYVHGHQVGGTNPSLVEAMGAGAAILAHDNPFNRWVAGPAAAYFGNDDECALEMDRLLSLSDDELNAMRDVSRERHTEAFTWPQILAAYEKLLQDWWQRV
jgi:glycosyltransferase involved in cell wall biosynthesis